MRRTAAVVLLCLSVALTGATGRPPAPSPSPSPSAQPLAAKLPFVVVYAFDTSSDIAPGNGVKASQLFVDQMNAAGGIDAVEAPSTVARADYLTHARSIGADYYVAGYMTPLGDGVSLVEQVVSTSSGTIMLGQTAQIQSFQDASSQAVEIHDAIVQREESLAQAYASAQASATSTPMPNNEANIGKGLAGIAGLFKRKDKAVATPAPVKPRKGVIVVHVNGSVPPNNLSAATTQLYDALNTYYNVRTSNAPSQNMTAQADGICGSDRDNTIATGMLSATASRHGLGTRVQWTFVLDVYTCWGAKLSENKGTGETLANAVTQAVSSYAGSHPLNG